MNSEESKFENEFEDSYRISLDIYEGPMELLLFLIRKNEVDVYDIPISLITRQYLEYLELIKLFNLEKTGEFIYLASLLMKIKSKMLLPRTIDEGEEEEDPRNELVKYILEYKKYREAAVELRKLEEIRKDFFSRSFFCGEKLVKNSEITLELNIFELLKAFKNIIEKSPEAVVEIQREQVPLELMINLIEQKLKTLKRIPLHSFLDQGFNKHEFIVLFIALLELMKNGKVRIRQSGFLKEIYIYPACAA